MGNPCKVLITRGKNKGKICGQVNAKCKHVTEPIICPKCKLSFDRTTSYYRHIKVQHDGNIKPDLKPKPKPKPKPEPEPGPKPEWSTLDKIKIQLQPIPIRIKQSWSKPELEPKPEMDLAPDTDTKPKDQSEIYHRLVQLEEQNNALREEVEELKLKPTTTNYIAILGNDFYTELTNKIGRENAMKFIAESGTKHPLSMFQKLYLDDRDPDDYPIACRDKYNFRYLDNQQRVVEDRGGSNIGTAVSKRLTDAMEHAFHDFQIEGHGNTVYGLEGVQKLRERLASLNQDSVIKELAYITNNPNHPFFRDD